jgi:hypothetical protein
MRAGILIAMAAVAGVAVAADLNYDEFIPLDAEALAETGLKPAYEELLPRLQKYVASPAAVSERIDSDAPSYAVSCLGTEYPIREGRSGRELGPGDVRALRHRESAAGEDAVPILCHQRRQ